MSEVITASDGEARVVTDEQRAQELAAIAYYEGRGDTIVQVWDQGTLALRVLSAEGMFTTPSGALLLNEIARFPEVHPMQIGGAVVHQDRVYRWIAGGNVYD